MGVGSTMEEAARIELTSHLGNMKGMFVVGYKCAWKDRNRKIANKPSKYNRQ